MALRRDSPSVLSSDFTHVSCSGEVAERSNAAVLKCVASTFGLSDDPLRERSLVQSA
jgi:hypothetical protein